VPKVDSHLVTEGLRGKIGDLVFRLMPNGETWVSRDYDFSNREFSPAQTTHQSRFQKATAYAKSAARKNPIYVQLAKGTVKSPYNLALSDWFKPPVIHQIERTKERIRVRATDNVQVTRVQVTIMSRGGKVSAKGEAIKGKGDWWEYVTNEQGSILVEAWDLAGNMVKS